MKRIIPLLITTLIAGGVHAQVQWHTMSQASNAKIEPRIYFVDFYTSWCGYCKKMDRDTFTDPTVAKILNKYYYPIKFDAESSEKITWFGTTYGFLQTGRSRIHELASGIKGFPTYRLYRADGSIIQDIPGYYPPNEFVIVLWYFASGDYNRYGFEQYRKIFDKEIRPSMEKVLNQ